MSNNRFLSTVYGTVSTIDNSVAGTGLQFQVFFGASGQARSWNNAVTEIRSVSPKQTINGVDINSLIVVLPTGLAKNGKETWYASVDQVSTINTAGA